MYDLSICCYGVFSLVAGVGLIPTINMRVFALRVKIHCC